MHHYGIALTLAMPYEIANFECMTAALGLHAQVFALERAGRVEAGHLTRGRSAGPDRDATRPRQYRPNLRPNPASSLEERLGHRFQRAGASGFLAGREDCRRRPISIRPSVSFYGSGGALSGAYRARNGKKSRRHHLRRDLTDVIMAPTDTDRLWSVARSLGIVVEAELTRRDLNAVRQRVPW